MKSLDNLDHYFLSLNENELLSFGHNVVKDCESYQIPKKNIFIVIDKLINHGFDINKIYFGLNFLHYAVKKNKILLVDYLIKKGADINCLTKLDQNVLHICAHKNNTHLMKFFIKKGVNINHKDVNQITPFMMSLHFDSYDCAKILLEYNIDINDVFEIICDKLSDEKDNFNENLILFENILRKKNKLNKSDYPIIDDLFIMEEYDVLRKIIERFPTVLASKRIKVIDYLAECKNQDFIKLCINKNFDLTKIDSCNKTLAHHYVNYGFYEIVEMIINKNKNIVDYKCSNNRNLLEYSLAQCEDKSEETTISLINLLVKNNCDINSQNTYGFSVVECAIQNSSPKVVELVINLGANIKLHRKNKCVYPCLTNNDPLSFAVQLGKFEIVKTLINYDVSIHMYSISKNNKIPTSIIIGILFDRKIILQYLLNLQKVKKVLNHKTKNYLLKLSLKEGFNDKDILKYFMTKKDFDKMNLDTSYMSLKKERKFIERNLDIDDEIRTYKRLLILANFYRSLIVYNNKQHIRQIFDNIEKIYNECAPNNLLIEHIARTFAQRIDFIDIEKLRTLFISTCELIKCDNLNEIHLKLIKFNKDDLNLKIGVIEQFIKNLKKLIKLKNDSFSEDSVGSYLDSENNSDFDTNYTYSIKTIKFDKTYNFTDSEEDIDFSYSNDTNQTIEKMLFKLLWPVKYDHYEEMYYLLNQPAKFNEDHDKISIDDKFIVFKNNKQNLKPPTKWIKFYAPNIGCKEKKDINHDFSYTFDKILQNYNCLELFSDDIMHTGKNAQLYFYGCIKNGDLQKFGCYEYFINSNGTLFHRMFRYIENLPKHIKSVFH